MPIHGINLKGVVIGKKKHIEYRASDHLDLKAGVDVSVCFGNDEREVTFQVPDDEDAKHIEIGAPVSIIATFGSSQD